MNYFIVFMVIAFATLCGVLLYMMYSPVFRLEAVSNLATLRKMLSAQVAAVGGTLALLIPVVDNLQQSLPQIGAIDSLHSITASHFYQVFTGLVTLFGIVARLVRQPSIPKPPQ